MRSRDRRRAPAIVLCSQNLPVPQDRRVWREATALAGAGYRVTVLCPSGSDQRRRERQQGVAIRRYPAAPQLTGIAGQVVETAWSLAWLLPLAIGLRLRGRLNILHAANPPDTYFLIAWVLRPLGVRFVYDQHDLCPELLAARSQRAPRWLAWLLLRLEAASYRRADLVIAPNNSYRGIALGRGGQRPDDVVVVRSGPDRCRTRQSAAGQRPLVVAFAGVMNEQDGVALLLEAATHVLAARPGMLVIDLIGTGDDVPRLRSLASGHGIADQVRWAGWLDGPALDDRIAAASVGVSIDGDDDFSRLSTMAKIPEYLGLGLPVLAADLPENRVTAGAAALYFDAGDADSLARCLLALLDDASTLERLERAAAARGPELAWSHSAERLVAAYARLLGSGPPVPGDQVIGAALAS
jgi:glycosyltransferase involved in cell wall biosynthesis